LKLTVRLLLYTLCGSMVGFWLSAAAATAVLAAGGPEAFVEFAYWPSRLCGMRLHDYMYPNLFGPILLNMLGWTILANLVGLLHHALVTPKASPSSRPPTE
jgi:hypothetical protein